MQSLLQHARSLNGCLHPVYDPAMRETLHTFLHVPRYNVLECPLMVIGGQSLRLTLALPADKPPIPAEELAFLPRMGAGACEARLR